MRVSLTLSTLAIAAIVATPTAWSQASPQASSQSRPQSGSQSGPQASSQSRPQSGTPLDQQVEEVASRLEGMMDTSAQAMTNPKIAKVRMTTCRVQVTATANPLPGVVLYQEQALTQNLTQPYRQRFLQILPSSTSQTVRSASFKPSNPAAWVNFCNQPIAARVVQLRDLGTPVCSVFLKPAGEDYVGNTPIDGCPANVRGAIRITNHIVLQKTGMQTWDRGFDRTGKQVWGAKAESYQFRKL